MVRNDVINSEEIEESFQSHCPPVLLPLIPFVGSKELECNFSPPTFALTGSSENPTNPLSQRDGTVASVVGLMESLLRTRWSESLVREYFGLRDLLTVRLAAWELPLSTLRRDVWICNADYGARHQRAAFGHLTLLFEPFGGSESWSPGPSLSELDLSGNDCVT